MKAFESLLEGRAQLIEEGRLTGEDSVTTWIRLAQLEFQIRSEVDTDRIQGSW